ncbi:MAG: HAMP domain-containing histidine kinase [Rhodanobacteraceae bacterium]|nr:HAMP domain-containing histidine kinase [Rhodanobacteraceae bacterium]
MPNSSPPRPADPLATTGRGLRGRLWVAFVMQTVAIALATLFGVYAAMLVLRDVLIQRALVEEAQHYWKRLDVDPAAALPDTYNMQGYLDTVLHPGDAVPAYLRDLAPGYHSIHATEVDELVWVGDRDGRRLWLVFDQHQVDRLALWFGLVPLTLVLGTVYLVSWTTYRASRRAVSPVIRLAEVVREQDPKNQDWQAICAVARASDADDEVIILADAIRGFAQRNAEFVERERNFTRDASHELRTPLTVIKVAADVLEEEALSAFGARSVSRIKRAARDMEALIQAFLILAREGDTGLPSERFVVNDIAAEEVERAQDLVAGKPVTIRFVAEARIELDAPPRVFAVMISNLLRNACQYTEQGEVVVTLGERFVRVDDSGPGMAPEDVAHAFEPFYRGKGAGKGGHGVGLTIVRRLADRFGWPVTLESTLGIGTRATIALPQARPTALIE